MLAGGVPVAEKEAPCSRRCDPHGKPDRSLAASGCLRKVGYPVALLRDRQRLDGLLREFRHVRMSVLCPTPNATGCPSNVVSMSVDVKECQKISRSSCGPLGGRKARHVYHDDMDGRALPRGAD